jgi:hypothetical protein
MCPLSFLSAFLKEFPKKEYFIISLENRGQNGQMDKEKIFESSKGGVFDFDQYFSSKSQREGSLIFNKKVKEDKEDKKDKKDKKDKGRGL